MKTFTTTASILCLLGAAPFAPTASASGLAHRLRTGRPVSVPARAARRELLDSIHAELLFKDILGEHTGSIGSLSMSMSMPHLPIKKPKGCVSAYVHCGDGNSVCTIKDDGVGVWGIDFKAAHNCTDFSLECEIRVGSGKCGDSDVYNTDSSADAVLGSMGISLENIKSEIFDDDLGATDFQLTAPAGNRRRLKRNLDDLGGIDLSGLDDIDLSGLGVIDVGGIVGELFHRSEFNIDEYDIFVGADLSESISVFATVCPCSSVEGGCKDDPNRTMPNIAVTAAPSDVPSTASAPAATPSTNGSGSTGQGPTRSPSIAPTSISANSVGKAIGSVSDEQANNGNGGGMSAGGVAGIVVAVGAVALIGAAVFVWKKNGKTGDEASQSSVSAAISDIQDAVI